MTRDGAGELETQGWDFNADQQLTLAAIGQALIGIATPGTAAVELTVAQSVDGDQVDLDFKLDLERQSGLSLPAAADDALVDAVQRLVLLWRAHDRAPWRTFRYRLSRGDSGPRFTSEFGF